MGSWDRLECERWILASVYLTCRADLLLILSDIVHEDCRGLLDLHRLRDIFSCGLWTVEAMDDTHQDLHSDIIVLVLCFRPNSQRP